jgi:hypothetical protein
MTITPPIAVAPPPVALALVDLTDCVCTELAATGAGPTCWCGLYPGATVSWEYCAECSGGMCGMGYVRFAGAFPYDTFPVPVVDDRCVRPLAWAVEVGALRCMPTPSDGNIVDPTAMTEVAVAQVIDAYALYRAIKCCGLEMSVERYYPVGPQGACVGGFWLAYVAIT